MDTLRLQRLRLTLVAESPLHIGSGTEGNSLVLLTAVMPFKASLEAGKVRVTMYKRIPFIPASSLKGALRAITERIAASIYHDVLSKEGCSEPKMVPRCLAALHHQPAISEYEARRRRRCQLTPPVHGFCEASDNALSTVHKEVSDFIKDFIERNQCLERDEQPTESSPIDWGYEHAASRLCPLCILYGSIHQAGAVRVTDAIAEASPITTRSRVSIDRATRTREERMLYVEELVPAGTRFHARLNIVPPLPRLVEENGECREAYDAALQEASRLWELTLEYVKRYGIVIGSGRSRGQGRLRITI